MPIRKYLATSMLSVALLLASSVLGLAKSSRSVTLYRNAVLNGTALPAGLYQVTWDADSTQATVQFERKHKVVLSTDARLEDRGKKYQSNMVVYDTAADGTMSLREIRFAGSSEVLVFSQ